MNEYELMARAIRGDELASKIYCGSYSLVYDNKDKKLYRIKDTTNLPSFLVEIKDVKGSPVYDKDGFLMSKYWSLPKL